MNFRCFLPAALAALFILPARADDLVVPTGTTAVRSDSAAVTGGVGHFDVSAGSFAGATLIESGATLQLGTGAARALTVTNVSFGSAGPFSLLGTGDVVNHGALVLNQRPVVFNQDNSGYPEGEPIFIEWFDGATFRLAIGNLISGTGTVEQTGSGTYTLLTGANTYTGTTTISGGTLALGGAGRLGTGALVLSGGTLNLGGTSATTVSSLSGPAGTIAGGGTLTVESTLATDFAGQLNGVSLVKSGPGTLTLTGTTDNNSASAVVNAGTLVLAKTSSSSVHAIGTALTVGDGGTARLGGTGDDQIFDAASVILLGGGTLDLDGRNETVGSLTGAGAVINSATSASTLGVANANALTFAGTLADGVGPLVLSKSGAGTLTLAGANTYTGGTTLAGGTLALGSIGALGNAGAIAFVGGALQWSADNTTDYSNRFSTAANQAYRFDTNGQDVTLASALASAGGTLTKLGDGTLTLSGANTYTGGTALGGGTLALASAGALGDTGTIAFAGGTLRWSAANTTDYSGRFSTAANQSFNFDTNGQDIALATALASSGGSLTKSGLGTLTLTGAQTLAGGIAVNGGTLALTGGAYTTGALAVAEGTVLRTNANAVTAHSLAGAGTIYGSLGDLAVTGSASTTFSGALVQTSLVKSGSGTLTLAGATDNNSAYASVTGGTLVLAKNSSSTVHALGTAQAHRIASGGTLRFGGTGGDQIYDGAALNLESGGTLDLNTRSETIGSGATLAGNVLIDLAGTARGASYGGLTVNGSVALGGALTLNLLSGYSTGATYNLFDYTGYTGNWSAITLAGTSTGAFTSAGSLWSLNSGDAHYTFDLTTGDLSSYLEILLASGTRALAATTQLGANGRITFGGGTLQWAAGNTTDYSANFSTAANQAYALDTNGQDITLAAALTSAGGSLTKAGAGTLTLTGTNTYSGGTTIAGGTLAVTGATALGSGAIVDHANLTLAATDAFTFASSVSGAGSLTKSGLGAVTLTGTNTYTGGTLLAGGTLTLGSAGALGDTGPITFDGGTLQWTEANTRDYSSRFADPTGRAFRFDTNGQNVTFGSAFFPGSEGSLTKLGAGTLTLAGNTVVGTTTISGGTLHLSAGLVALGNTAIDAGATLSLAALGTYEAAALTGAGTVSGGLLAAGARDASSTFAGVLQNLYLAKAGAGTLTLTGNSDNSSTGTNVLGGTLVLAKDSSSTVHALGGTSTLTVSGGTLRLAGTGGDQIYDGSALRLTSGTFDLNGRSETILALSGDGGTVTNTAVGTVSTLTLGGATTDAFSDFAGSLADGAGQLALVKNGTGSLWLGGAATHTGATTIADGALILRDGASLTGTTRLALAGKAYLSFDRSNTVTVGALSGTVDTIVRGGDRNHASQSEFGVLTINGSADSTFSGTMLDLTLAKTGTGTLTLATVGSPDSEFGTGVVAHVEAGTLVLAGEYQMILCGFDDAGSAHTVAAGATLRLAGIGGDQISWADRVAVAAGGTFDLNGRSEGFSWLTDAGLATNTAAGTLSTLTLGGWQADGASAVTFADGAGQLALVKRESGTLTLTGASTYTGGTSVTGGTLQIGDGGTTGSIAGDVALANGTALAFNRADALTYVGAIGGTGSLVKRGTGVLTLTGANTFTGGTTVDAGRLVVDGSLASAVTVESGATLGGSGRVGTVTLLAGATLAPGNSPGLLTIGSGSSLAGNVVMEIAGTGRGVAYDAIDVSGAGLLALGGTLTLEFSTAATTGATYHLFDFSSVTGDWSAVSLAGLYSGNLAESGGLWSLTTGGYAFAFNTLTGDLAVTASAIPEPATAALLAGLGVLGVLLIRRGRQAGR
jgi:fibronectin-binding autotransporter adhesin